MTKKKAHIVKQKKQILQALKGGGHTISELAEKLSVSGDTIRNRINEMVAEQCQIRVAGWKVLETTMVRVWGYGEGRDEPRPIRIKISKPRPRLAVGVMECSPQDVKYRREEMDEWLFRARGCNGYF